MIINQFKFKYYTWLLLICK